MSQQPAPQRPVDHRAFCPDPSQHYVTRVNKDDINMRWWAKTLNDHYTGGYRLAHVFEQHGNTVMVFEHAFH